jgi:hypothetical protein
MSAVDHATAVAGRAELRLAAHACAVLAVLAIPLLLGAAAWQGTAGAAGAAAGIALVALLFGVAGLAQGLAARRSRTLALGVAACGFGARLAVYLAALQALSQVTWLHRPSLAIATAVAFVVTLHHEIRLISRSPEMFWLEVDADTQEASLAGAAAPASRRRS